MTGKVTVKEIKIACSGKINHPRNHDPNKSRRPCVDAVPGASKLTSGLNKQSR